MFKRTSSIFIIAALLVVVSIDAKAQRAPSYGGTLIISGSQPMYSLDPTAAEHDEEYLFADLVYSNLTKLKSDYTPEPELAENWKSSKSGDHWIFELRKGVKWHNGKELTADDVVYSLTRAKQPGTTTQSLIKAIDSVEALDQYTVKINMNSVYPDIPSTLASPHLSILPKWNKHFATVPIGTGPFKVSQIIPGESVMVSKFDGYFEKGLPYLDAIKLVFHPDPAATIASLLAGDIDVAWNGRPEWEPLIKKNPNVELLKAPGFAHNCIEIMTDRKPFDDVRVRQAIAYTIDREMLVATVLIGHGIPASDSPMPPANPYYNSEIPLRKQDYKKARSLLEQAGYSQGLKLTLFTSESRAGQLGTALALQDMAKPAGIEIKVVNVDPSRFWSDTWKKEPFLVSNWYTRFLPNEAFWPYFHSTGQWNFAHYRNRKMDELLEKAQSETDIEKRKKLYKEVQAILYNDVPWIVTHFRSALWGIRKGVHYEGIRLYPTNFNEVYKSWKEK